jgi:glycine/D-amino acid oxidase-like deaminating enzyme
MVGASARAAVLLATAARRNGWLWAPTVARLIADQLAQRDGGPLARPFDPGRFEV